jgi:hypothetical protein
MCFVRSSRKRPLFEKKAAQKLLLNWAAGAEISTAQCEKSFLLLFSKKEALPFL